MPAPARAPRGAARGRRRLQERRAGCPRCAAPAVQGRLRALRERLHRQGCHLRRRLRRRARPVPRSRPGGARGGSRRLQCAAQCRRGAVPGRLSRRPGGPRAVHRDGGGEHLHLPRRRARRGGARLRGVHTGVGRVRPGVSGGMSAAARDVLAAGRRLPRLPVLAVAVLACAVGAACAAEEPPSPWRFEIEPYGWVSGTYGTIDVDQYVARLDVTPGNLLTAVFDGNALAAAGYFAVAYERWSVFADVYGGGAKVNVDEDIPTPYCTLTVDAKDTMRFVLADFAVGYRLGQWSLPERRLPLELGVYAGARYVHFANHLRGGVAVVGGQRYSGDADEANDWADPIIGVRWSVPVLDSVSLTFRGDIGGFGASSDLDWGLVSDVRYWSTWRPWSAQPYVAAGYRVVGIDRSPSNGVEANLQLRGPLAGMGFVF